MNGYFKKVDESDFSRHGVPRAGTVECLLLYESDFSRGTQSDSTTTDDFLLYDTAAVRVMYTCTCSTVFLQYTLFVAYIRC